MADLARTFRKVANGPLLTHAPQRAALLFDDLVGGCEQIGRHGQAITFLQDAIPELGNYVKPLPRGLVA
jgi:hypothetical protein